jgi:hypothetical protein
MGAAQSTGTQEDESTIKKVIAAMTEGDGAAVPVALFSACPSWSSNTRAVIGREPGLSKKTVVDIVKGNCWRLATFRRKSRM